MKGVLRESLLVGKHSGLSQLRHSSWVTAWANRSCTLERPIVAGVKPLWDSRRHLDWEVDPLATEAIDTASGPKKLILICVSTSTGLPCTR
jgi:hypothetical protein